MEAAQDLRPARRGGINGHTAGWTDAENKLLKELYPTALRAKVEEALPGRSWNAMGLQAQWLGLKRRHYWNAKRLALLQRHYPTKGAPYVAKLLGCDLHKVTKQASLQGIARIWPEKPAPTPKAPCPAPLSKPLPKPKPQPVPEPVAQHQPARLTNLIAQKSLQRKTKATDAPVTADYIRKLPYSHPERLAYMNGGIRGWQELKKAA